MSDQPAPQPPPLTPQKVVVSVLMLVCAGLLIALFVTPNSSPWFWPIAGAMLVCGLIAYLIPVAQSRDS